MAAAVVTTQPLAGQYNDLLPGQGNARLPVAPFDTKQEALQTALNRIKSLYGGGYLRGLKKINTGNLSKGSSNEIVNYQVRVGNQTVKFTLRINFHNLIKITNSNRCMKAAGVCDDLADHLVRRNNEGETIYEIVYKERPQDTYLHAPAIRRQGYTQEEFLQQIVGNEQNWHKANEFGLSPQLYYYGYIKDGPNLRMCTINEMFTSNLHDFLNKIITPSTIVDGNDPLEPSLQFMLYHTVAQQLYDLFSGMARNMKTICFDIKPENIVIRYDEDEHGMPINNNNLVVKLIDWDADWCKQYNHYTIDDSYIDASVSLMMIVMATFFYQRYQYNFLKNFIRSLPATRAFLQNPAHGIVASYHENDTYNKMLEIFFGNDTFFIFMAQHYFHFDYDVFRYMYTYSLMLNRFDTYSGGLSGGGSKKINNKKTQKKKQRKKTIKKIKINNKKTGKNKMKKIKLKKIKK